MRCLCASVLRSAFVLWLLSGTNLAWAVTVPYVEWTKKLDASSSDNVGGVATDTVGNLYICGGTYGSLYGSNPAAEYNTFVAKYDPTGNLLWGNQLSSPGGAAITLDTSGAIYVAGDGVVQKFGPNGVLQWDVRYGTTWNFGCGGIALDGSGNIFVAGHAYGDSWGTSYGDRDAFVGKLDPAGKLLWVKQFGTANDDTACRLAIDSHGNAIVAGNTSSVPGADFWWENGFVAKLDPAGNMQWNNVIGPSATASIHTNTFGITVDPSDAIYIGGTANHSLYGERYKDCAYMMKWDTNGSRQWLSRYPGDGGTVTAVGLDPCGGEYALTNSVGLYKFDSLGSKVWGISPGGYFATEAAVGNGRVFVAGTDWSYGGGFDIYVTSIVVPEPSTFALLGAGAISLLGYACRRRNGGAVA